MLRSQKTTKIEETRYVSPGETALGSKNEVLISTPLGSCVAVIVFDKTTGISGMAHVMLPGKSPAGNAIDKNKYASNAISSLAQQLSEAGVFPENLAVCLAGGANVLKRPNETIARDVVKSVLNIAEEKKLNIKATSLGGMERRTVTLNAGTGIVYYTIGDSSEKVLWNFFNDMDANGLF